MSSQPQQSSSGQKESPSEKDAGPISITVNQLGKKFNREWIFRNFNYTFSSGQVYAVTGPNGSGKSTLLQVLWGQMPPSTGTLNYFTAQGQVPIEEVYKYISVATPYLDLIDEFTLIEQLRFHFNLKSRRFEMTDEEMIERMYLTNARDKQLLNFSSGMKQRVKLALAFFTKTNVLFLDEPGTNLDKTAFEWYVRELSAVPSDCLVFIASNQPTEYPVNAQKIDITGLK